MASVPPAERAAMVAHIARELRPAVCARNVALTADEADARAGELAARFEAHVFATSASREDYGRAIASRLTDVRASATASEAPSRGAVSAKGADEHAPFAEHPHVHAAHVPTEDSPTTLSPEGGPFRARRNALDAAPADPEPRRPDADAVDTAALGDDRAIVAAKLARLQSYMPSVDALLAHPAVGRAPALPADVAEARGRLSALRTVVARQLAPLGDAALTVPAATNIVDQVRHYASVLRAHIGRADLAQPPPSTLHSVGSVLPNPGHTPTLRESVVGANGTTLNPSHPPTLRESVVGANGTIQNPGHPPILRESVSSHAPQKALRNLHTAGTRTEEGPRTKRPSTDCVIDTGAVDLAPERAAPAQRITFLAPAHIRPVPLSPGDCSAAPPADLQAEMDAWASVRVLSVGKQSDAVFRVSFSAVATESALAVEVRSGALDGGRMGVEMSLPYPSSSACVLRPRGTTDCTPVLLDPPLLAPVSLTALLLRFLVPLPL